MVYIKIAKTLKCLIGFNFLGCPFWYIYCIKVAVKKIDLHWKFYCAHSRFIRIVSVVRHEWSSTLKERTVMAGYLFIDRVSLGSRQVSLGSHCPGTHAIDQAVLKLKRSIWVMPLKLCITIACLAWSFFLKTKVLLCSPGRP